MVTPKFNTKSPTIKRILKEASELSAHPSADYCALPASDSDIFDWHFTIRGPPATPYAHGLYHGRIVLPPTYPLRPPSFRFLTPSGRFECNREICLSISGHHEETWQPAWGIRTALVALRAFMESDAKGQLGGLESSARDRERFATQSSSWKCGVCAKSNEEILNECAETARLKEEEDAAEGNSLKKEELEIPKELQLGYKDELGGKCKEKEKEDTAVEDIEAIELAEGFVQTTHPNSYPPARPAQSVPQPTATIPQTEHLLPPQVTEAARIVHAYQQRQGMERRLNDSVPVWIDRSIAVVVVCLVFLVLKMLLGL